MTDSTAGAPGDCQPKKELTGEGILAYTTADAVAMSPTQPRESTISSPFLRRVAWVCIAIVIPVHLFMGIMLDVEFTGAYITFIDKLAFPGIGIVISIIAWLAFNRPRLRAN